jgi:hypothetical protein
VKRLIAALPDDLTKRNPADQTTVRATMLVFAKLQGKTLLSILE